LQNVYKFDPFSNTVVRLENSRLPYSMVAGTAVLPFGKTVAYLFAPVRNGANNIMEFDLESEKAETIGGLPGPIRSIGAIYDGNKAWLFRGSQYTTSTRDPFPIVNFNLETTEVSYFMDNRTLPLLYAKPAVAWDGKFGYIIGGYGEFPYSGGTLTPTNGILR
jgi:hypothetical protein